MKLKHFSSDGFSLIEVLIVIIVIGVLTLLATNFFGGATDEASNARTITNVRTYRDAFAVMIQETGSLGTGTSARCIGTGYPDMAGSSGGDCYWRDDFSSQNTESFGYMSEVQPFSGTTELVNDDPVRWGDWLFAGAFIYRNTDYTLDSQDHLGFIRYHLHGPNQDCGLPSVRRGTGWGHFVSSVPNNWYSSSTAYDSTMCLVAVPNLQ